MKIKRWIGMILTCALIFIMTGCGAGNQTQPDDAGTSDDTAQVSASADDETLKEAQAEEHSDTQTSNAGDNTTGGGNILVVYFSYTGHLDSMANWIADERPAATLSGYRQKMLILRTMMIQWTGLRKNRMKTRVRR